MTPRESSIRTLCGALLVACLVATSCFCGCTGTAPGRLSPSSGNGARRFSNIVNEPFATIASGPMDALFIEEGAGDASVRQAMADPHPGLDRLYDFLGSAGAKPPETRPTLTRCAIHTRGDELLLPDRAEVRLGARQAGGGTLSFAYEGWSAEQESDLKQFVEAIYPVCVEVYGQPAFSNTVTIVLDPAETGLLGGIYDATANEIRIPGLTDNTLANQSLVIRHMLHAFHDDALFFYEQWEQGFAIAAADVILRKFDSTFDPSYGPFYVTNLYEFLNAPELGHDRIFDTGFDGMLTWRLGMSSGAWSKCWVEDDAFFRNFNEAYYATWTGDQATAGNVPVLASLAAGVLSGVEGLPFYEWFRRQYALDTSLNKGERFYIYNLPQNDSVILVIDYFTVTTEGQEVPKGGTVELEFFDYTLQFSLFVQEGYEAVIPNVGTDAGQGFYIGSLFNIGGAQRITITMKLGPIQRQVIYPYGVRGPDVDGSSFLGSVIGREEGTIRISINDAEAEELEVSQGAFGAVVGGGESRPAKVTYEFEDLDGTTITRRVNTGFFFYGVLPSILERREAQTSFLAGTTGINLISIPGYPVDPNDSSVLGIDVLDLRMAYWDPTRADDNKYEIYPNMPPMAPGRGYWLKIDTNQAVEFPMDALPPGTNLSLFLTPGWNLIGCPYEQDVPLQALGFDRGAGPVAFAQAVQNGWVRAVVFDYDQTRGYTEASALQTWRGYWVRCIVAGGVNMIIPNPRAAAQGLARGATPALPQPDWTARLLAEGALGSTASVTVGAAADAGERFDALYDAGPPPPAPGTSMRLYSLPPGGTVLWRDVRSSLEARHVFDLSLTGVPTGRVRLGIEDAGSLPRGATLTLRDGARGREYDLTRGEVAELSGPADLVLEVATPP